MQKPYFLEGSLPKQVGKYMQDNEHIDIEDMTKYLIENCHEYRYKKLKLFKKSVEKAYNWEKYCQDVNKSSSEIEIDDSDGGTDEIQEIEAPLISSASLSKTKRKNLDGEQILPNGDFKRFQESFNVKTPSSKRQKSDDAPTPTPITKRKRFEVQVPLITFNDMEGISSLQESILDLLESLVYNEPDQELTRSAIITGPEGSGKSMLAKAIAGSTGANFLTLSSSDVIGGIPGESGKRIKEAFQHALMASPCVIFLERLQAVTPKDGVSNRNSEKRMSVQIAECITKLKEEAKDKCILILAEARQPDDIEWNLRSVFETEIFMPSLDVAARERILKLMFPSFNFMSEISHRTPSFVAGDLRKLIKNSKKIARRRLRKLTSQSDLSFGERMASQINMWKMTPVDGTVNVTLADFMDALPDLIPALKREGFPGVPDITWEDVGGLEDIKVELREKILDPMAYPLMHKKYGVAQPNGIMLWGPPGCGKTLLAKALANQAGINFLAVRGPELLSMYQGESERKIREVFLRAKTVAPCVIFFDEFDGICPIRTKGAESGSRTTIVHTLLVEMNGFTSRDDVYVMAATNRPDMIDPAVTRPGRFDTLLYVGMPDLASRIAVLKACSKNGTYPKFGTDVDLSEVAKQLDRFSGADCSNLIYLASKEAIKEVIESENGKKSETSEFITKSELTGTGEVFQRHLDLALKRIRPSVATEELKRYLKLRSRLEARKEEGKEITFIDTKTVPEELMENQPVASSDSRPVLMGM